jgi:hypothetical protein
MMLFRQPVDESLTSPSFRFAPNTVGALGRDSAARHLPQAGELIGSRRRQA